LRGAVIMLSDRMGRRQRLTSQSTGKRVTPQDRDLLWFSKLAEHGPLPSLFLLQYTKDMRRSDKRARERLTDLFNEDNTPDGGPYLTRPPQQFRTLDSRYNQLVYDVTPASKKALQKAELLTDATASPSGPWLHSFMVSCITASAELATLDHPNITYIPQSAILARANTDLRFPVTIIDPATNRNQVKDLIPDAVFGLEYHTDSGSRFRFFAVEADRATEPATSGNFNRKSFMRSLLQYEAYVAGGAYRQHLSLTAPLLVLTVSSDPVRTARMIDLTAKHYPSGNAFMLFQTWDDFGPVFRPPLPNPALLIGDWGRARFLLFRVSSP
jgi:Replication-relaxation